MKRYLELNPDLQDQFNTLALVLGIEFRRLREGESLLWATSDADGMREIENATSDLPDLVVMQFVPPFPDDSYVVVGTHSSISTVKQRLAGLGWEKASADDEEEFYDYMDRRHDEYWDSLTIDQQDRVIGDYIAEAEGIKRKGAEDRLKRRDGETKR